METELRKLPKDILIEIIKKGFDMNSLSEKQLYKFFNESKQILKDKVTKRLKSNIVSLYEDEDVKIILECKYWDYRIDISVNGNRILTIEFLERVIYFVYDHSYDRNYFIKKDFDSFLILIKQKLNRGIKMLLDDEEYRLSEEINWDSLKEMYDNFTLWIEVH